MCFEVQTKAIGVASPENEAGLRSHQLSSGIVWLAIGSLKTAPGMSDSVRITPVGLASILSAIVELLRSNCSSKTDLADLLRTRYTDRFRLHFKTRVKCSSISRRSLK